MGDRLDYSPSPPAFHLRSECDAHILLLGAGDVGKSTLFKQFSIIYGEGYKEEHERQNVIDVIYNNVITHTKTLIEAAKELEGFELTDAVRVIRTSVDTEFSPRVADAIASVLKNTAVSRCLQTFRYRETIDHFSQELHSLSRRHYIPSVQDVLSCRIRTLGMIEKNFVINGVKVRVTDTGGQRNERKKWPNVMETASCVLFVVNLNGYILPLFEESRKNCLKEDLLTFDYVVNYPHFAQVPICVLLNQKDLFQKTLSIEHEIEALELHEEVARSLRSLLPSSVIPTVTAYCQGVPRYPLSNVFPEYVGGNHYEPAIEYITQQFQILDKRKPETRPPVVFVTTCALDTEEVQRTYSVLFEDVLQPSPLTSSRSTSRSPSPLPRSLSPLPRSVSSSSVNSSPTPSVSRTSWTPSPSKAFRRIKRALSFQRANSATAPAPFRTSVFPLSLSPPPQARSLSAVEDVHMMIAGGPSVGKSTIFKQFLHLYGGGYPESERKGYQPAIGKNVLVHMKNVLKIEADNFPALSREAEESAKFIRDIDPLLPLYSPGVAAAINTLANDASMSERIDSYQHGINARYFFGKVHQLATPTYLPSIDDLLSSSVPTTQNEVITVKMNLNQFRVRCTDTSNKKEDRQAAQDTATCLVFVANMNGYTHSNGSQNCLSEDLALFSEMCNLDVFSRAPVFVLLNQKDLFQRTLRRSEVEPLRAEIARWGPHFSSAVTTLIAEFCVRKLVYPLDSAFPGYAGGEDYSKALKFLTEKFHALDRRNSPFPLRCLPVCAIDTGDVKSAFNLMLEVLQK